jgi:hypothetical protein
MAANIQMIENRGIGRGAASVADTGSKGLRNDAETRLADLVKADLDNAADCDPGLLRDSRRRGIILEREAPVPRENPMFLR